MKIENHTHYVTIDLKSFIVRAIKESIKAGEDNRTQNLTVKIVHSKGTLYDDPVERYTGYAYYNGRFMRLRVPKQINDKERFAYVVMHEYDHILGYKHRQMDRNYNTAWVSAYEFRVKEPKVKVKEKVDIRLVRYEHTQKLLQKKQIQLKRLQASIRKYTKRMKYYEKMLVAKSNVNAGQNQTPDTINVPAESEGK